MGLLPRCSRNGKQIFIMISEQSYKNFLVGHRKYSTVLVVRCNFGQHWRYFLKMFPACCCNRSEYLFACIVRDYKCDVALFAGILLMHLLMGILRPRLDFIDF